MGLAAGCRAHFGGPELVPGALRDLLAEHVAAVPAGGEIDWVTYYFRDRRLAAELVAARRRGVRVRVTVEGRPRTAHANDAVFRLLSGDEGLGEGLRRLLHEPFWTPRGKRVHPRLHTKLYCFSHPEPLAFVGSFNPSGDQPELAPEVIDEIRDQDRGYNSLVAIRQPAVVQGLVTHARWLHASRHHRLERFSPAANRVLRGNGLAVHFLPSLRRNPMLRLAHRLGRGCTVRIAASHVKGRTGLRALLGMARRGAAVTVLSEETVRRVPERVAEALEGAGITFRRVCHPDGLPMHDKFVLAEEPGRRHVVFGSCNWTERSLRTNHEIVAVSSEPDLFRALAARWEVLAEQAGLPTARVPPR